MPLLTNEPSPAMGSDPSDRDNKNPTPTTPIQTVAKGLIKLRGRTDNLP